MVKTITIGGGLTKRSIEVYALGELKDKPEIRDSWHVERRRHALADKCRKILKDAGLPDCSGVYVTWMSERTSKPDWYEENDKNLHRQEELRAAGVTTTRIFGFYDGDAEADSPVQLAAEILSSIEQLSSPSLGFHETVQTAEEQVEWDEYLKHRRDLLIQKIGELQERLFWKQHHEAAAVSAYEAANTLRTARKVAALENQDRARERKELVFEQLSKLSSDDQAGQSNRSLARHFLEQWGRSRQLQDDWKNISDARRSGKPGSRAIQQYVAELRCERRLAPHLKKK